MTRSLIPFATRLPRAWGNIEREMEDTMRHMFDWDRFGGNESSSSFAPNLNVAESETGYEITVDLPGMKMEEVNVEFKDDCLWISGERRAETEEEGKAFHCIERQHGAFRRVIRLNTDMDPNSIDANYHDGVLTITAAKSEAARPKRINVHA